ncbi:MAG: hypothetical protein AB2A00_30830 [Myxococcota bacterium]
MSLPRLLPFSLAALVACSTSQSAETKKTPPADVVTDGGAAQPAGASTDGGTPPVTSLEGLPDPGLAPGAWLAYDTRGAFSPYLATHVDVFSDGTVKCFRRVRMAPDQVATLTLADAEKAALTNAVTQDKPADARPVLRQGMVMDIGTTTVSAQLEGRVVSLVVDGKNNVEPPPTNLTLQLGALAQRCLGSRQGGAQ